VRAEDINYARRSKVAVRLLPPVLPRRRESARRLHAPIAQTSQRYPAIGWKN